MESGIYCLTGSNGCGKSTVMSCLAQQVFTSSLGSLNYTSDSFVKAEYDGKITTWKFSASYGKWRDDEGVPIHFNGMYEGSLFYGTRFSDSLVIDDMLQRGDISPASIVDADQYVKEKLSFILHGDSQHYSSLKRIKNRKTAELLGLKNMPYFQELNGSLVSQYRMSSGECMLISLLHFIYNALVRKSLPVDQPVLMIVDEIELALHPLAASRLIDLINEILADHKNLTVYLSSHSPEVVCKIKPENLFMMEALSDGKIKITNPCYPHYAIRTVYTHSGFDNVILVEDTLAKYIVEEIITKLGLHKSRLIHVLPSGGWENVINLHKQVLANNSFGIGTKVFSVLDGDVQNEAVKLHKSLAKLFLPISSVEKYLYTIAECKDDEQYAAIKQEINDTFFNVKSLDAIFEDYHREIQPASDKNGKKLYSRLIDDMKKRDISEEYFIKGLCRIVMKYTTFQKFEESLSRELTKE